MYRVSRRKGKGWVVEKEVVRFKVLNFKISKWFIVSETDNSLPFYYNTPKEAIEFALFDIKMSILIKN